LRRMFRTEPLLFFIACGLREYYTCFEALGGSRDRANPTILDNACLASWASLPDKRKPLNSHAVAPPAPKRLNARVNPCNPSASETHMLAGVSTVPKQLLLLFLANKTPFMALILVNDSLEEVGMVDEPAPSTPVLRIRIALVPNFYRVITSVA